MQFLVSAVFLLAVPMVLGCLLEGTTILLVIVPALIPTAKALEIDLVHFGIVVVINIMLGLITPPYGLLLFVMNRIAEVPVRDIVRDVMPFLLAMIAALAVITFLVTWACMGLIQLVTRLQKHTQVSR